MKRENYRYSGYRGRATTTDKLRMIAMVLFVLVLLAVAALLIGQRYIVYTDDGLRLELPFLDREEEQPLEDLENIEVVIEPAKSEEDLPAAEPVEEEELWLKAVTLPLESVLDGTAAQRARQVGANAIVLDMKTDLGMLGYCSNLPLAVQAGANYADSRINGELGELSGGEFYLVARISCFRDRALAEDLAYAIHTNSDRRWIDYESVRWSNPASQEVQTYLSEIMLELAYLGFDEILLDNWGYPTQADGQLEYIKPGEAYPEGELDVVIGAFLQRAVESLADSGTILSLQADGVVLSYGLESGQTPELMTQEARHIWLGKDTETAQAAQYLPHAGEEDTALRLVESVLVLEPEAEGHQWLNTEM